LNEKIIRFTPSDRSYYPKSVDADFMKNDPKYMYSEDLEIRIGKSIIGGPFVDLPEGLNYPEDCTFVAQLNLLEFAQFDTRGLLPKTGFLHFFTTEFMDNGYVFYSDVKENDLTRVVREHDKNFYLGNVIKSFFPETESLESRYTYEDGKKEWDSFSGSEISKIYGIYTHCQLDEKEIIGKTKKGRVVLLQIGEDFTDEGVFSVLIEKNDLAKKNFRNCDFDWGQS